MTIAAIAVLLAVSAWLEGPQSLAAKSKGTVVLVNETTGSYATTIRAVVEADGKGGFVAPPGLPLGEVVLALGCAKLDAACAAQIADTLDANTALLVDVVEDGMGVNSTMQLVSKGGKALRPPATFFVPVHDPKRPLRDRIGRVGRALGLAASAYARKLPMPALLWVESSSEPLSVTVDDATTTLITPAELVDLPAGPHRIVTGTTTTTEVMLETGKVVIVWVGVVAPVATTTSVATEPTKVVGGPPAWAWPVAGGGIAAIVIGGSFGAVHNWMVVASYYNGPPNERTPFKPKTSNPVCIYGCASDTVDGIKPSFYLAHALAGVGYVVAGLGVAATATGLWATTWEE
jgi:hypothetical protein